MGEVGEPKASRVGGIDCLVHLAATPDDSHFPPQPLNNFESELLPSNLLGGYRVTPPGGGVTQTTIRDLWAAVERQTKRIGETASATPRGVTAACLAFNHGLNTALQELNPFFQAMLDTMGYHDLVLRFTKSFT